tara:strand:- start:2537 stop:4132 length:1596 start_codon:yes stop_codon:yes gene_type:complete
MATYYKFKEREDPTKSMIDWAGITKTLSDGITAESTRRTDLKAELDNDYVAQLNALDEVTQGSNQSFNQAMLKFSHNYKDYLMNNHNMMKRGIISVNDSKMAKQGAKDSFTNLNNVAKNFDTQLQAIIDKGGNANDWLSQQAVDFIDVKNQQLLIDPTTGTASFGRFMEDGKTIDKATITPIGSMGQKFKPFERFDNDKEIAAAVKGFSSIYKIAQGSYKSVSDIMEKPGVSEAIDKRIDAMIAGGKDISAAVDFLDMKLTSDESLKDDPDYIFVENEAGGTMFKPKLSEEQTKKLKAALREQVVMGLGVEITQTEPSQNTKDKGDAKLAAEQNFNTLADWLTTGEESIGASLINATGDSIQSMRAEGDFIVVVSPQGGQSVKVRYKDDKGNMLDAEAVLRGLATNFGVTTEQAKEFAVKYRGRKVSDLIKNIEKTTEFTLDQKQSNLLALYSQKKKPSGMPGVGDLDFDTVNEQLVSIQALLNGEIARQNKNVEVNKTDTQIKIGDKLFDPSDINGMVKAIKNSSPKKMG